jgi:hypothetical protein
MALSIPIPRAGEFFDILNARLFELYELAGEEELIMPIGLFMLLDKENGGDATAEEIQRRFKILNFESGNVIDFYFLGWHPTESHLLEESGNIQFSLRAFKEFRTLLRNLGIKKFGGNADLILVDAHIGKNSEPKLNFSKAIYIDLARQMAENNFPTLGGLLQSIIDAADDVRKSQKSAEKRGVVYSISDKLGIAFAKQSILQFFLNKYGKIIGAKRLAAVSIQNLAPDVTWSTLQRKCSRSSS